MLSGSSVEGSGVVGYSRPRRQTERERERSKKRRSQKERTSQKHLHRPALLKAAFLRRMLSKMGHSLAFRARFSVYDSVAEPMYTCSLPCVASAAWLHWCWQWRH